MQRTILVVDDDPTFVEVMRDLLQMHDLRVITASNGVEALSHLKSGHKVDAIICDIEMPVMDGITFHKEVTKQGKFGLLPFVFVTGTDESKFGPYVRENPSIKIIRKPEMVDNLLSFISGLSLQSGN